MKTNKLKLILSALAFFAVLIFASCEDIIEVNLDGIEQKIVVEGSIIKDSLAVVKITQTADYYDPQTFPPAIGATVTLTDDAGNSETLTETADGIYKTTEMIGVENRTYTLKIEYDGEEYETSSKLQKFVDEWGGLFTQTDIEFNDTVFSLFTFLGLTGDVEPATTNYYRLKDYKPNDSNKGRGTFNLYDDTQKLGDTIIMQLPSDYELWDTVVVEFWCINKKTYDYYNTISDIASDGGGGPPPTSTPANPTSDFTNGAFGHFAACSMDLDTFLVFHIPLPF